MPTCPHLLGGPRLWLPPGSLQSDITEGCLGGGGVSRPLGSRPPASPQPAVFFAVRKPPTSCASTSDQLRLNQATRRPTHIPNLLQQKSNRGRL